MQLLVLFMLAVQQGASAPPSRPIGEHTAAVMRLAVSTDGKTLYTASRSGEIHAWDLEKDEVLWKTEMHQNWAVGFDAGEKQVAASMGFAAVDVFDAETGERTTGIAGTTMAQSCKALVIDPRDRWVWMGTAEGVLTRVVPGSVNSWSNRRLANRGVTCLALDAKGNTLAAGGADGSIRFVNAKSASVDEKKVIEAHGTAVSAVVLDAKGTRVISGAEDGAICVWKVSNTKLALELEGHPAAIRGLAVDPKARRLASGDAKGTLKLWDLKKGELLLTLQEGEQVTALLFLEKGDTLATAGSGERVTLWDLSEL